MTEGKVYYEGWISNSNAAFARLGRHLVHYRVQLIDSHILGSSAGDTVVLRLKMSPSTAIGFAKDTKIRDLRYKSPTRFNNGTLIPLYKTPEEELTITDAEQKLEK